MTNRHDEGFGIPASARVPDPPEGADYAAVGAVYREGVLVAHVLVTVRTWTQRGRDGGDYDYDLLRNGRLRWSGVVYDLRWIPWPESEAIWEQHFA